MGALGDMIEDYRDGTDPRVTNAWIGRKVGVGRSAVGPWLSGESMPAPDRLRRIADLIGQPYSRVLDAALTDNGYLPKEREGRAVRPAAKTTPGSGKLKPALAKQVSVKLPRGSSSRRRGEDPDREQRQ